MRKKEEISPRQEEILLFIQDYYKKNGYPPTVREIGEGVGLLSSCTVHYHLEKLEEKGMIKRSRSKARTIELCFPYQENNWQDWHILKGDWVLAKKEEIISGEGLVLIVKNERGEIWRVDGNSSFSLGDGEIIGKIIGIWRKL